jgi:uncharacterized protein (TIGR03083 family)
VQIAEHIEELEQDGLLMAAAAERAGLSAPVPACPGWQVRDLLRHQSHVHRWATRFVAEGLPDPVPKTGEAEILAGGPPDERLLAWFRAGHAALVSALRAAPPDLACWMFLPAPSPLAFWARRQSHETAIHRIDAERAAGGEMTPVRAQFAADGIDELIMGFFGRDARKLSDAQRAGARQTICVQATDTGNEWLVELTADGTRAASVRRSAGHGGLAGAAGLAGLPGAAGLAGLPGAAGLSGLAGAAGLLGPTADPAAGCVLAGPAASVYLVLWNRADPAAAAVTVTGADTALRAWRGGMRVTWS